MKYVDDILIILDRSKTDGNAIHNSMNKIHPLVQFTPTIKQNITITYLDLTLHRLVHCFQFIIYHKPTQTYTTIHFTSNHPAKHKLAAYNFHINRMLSFTITDQARQREWHLICTMAMNNGFPLQLLQKIRNSCRHSHN
jgi:hypothetical protein